MHPSTLKTCSSFLQNFFVIFGICIGILHFPGCGLQGYECLKHSDCPSQSCQEGRCLPISTPSTAKLADGTCQVGIQKSLRSSEKSAFAGVSFHPLNQTLASVDSTGKVELWDIASEKRTQELASSLPSPTEPPKTGTAVPEGAIQFSPDGKYLAACRVRQGQSQVDIWDTGTWQHRVTLAQKSCLALAFSQDSSLLAANEYNSPQIRVWNVTSGEIMTQGVVKAPSTALLYYSKDNTLAVANDAYVTTMKMQKDPQPTTLLQNPGLSMFLSADAERRWLAVSLVSQENNKVLMQHQATPVSFSLSSPTPAAISTSGPRLDIIAGMDFHPQGKVFGAVTLGGDIGLWKIGTLEENAHLSSKPNSPFTRWLTLKTGSNGTDSLSYGLSFQPQGTFFSAMRWNKTTAGVLEGVIQLWGCLDKTP